jgi:hypothetical protein
MGEQIQAQTPLDKEFNLANNVSQGVPTDASTTGILSDVLRVEQEFERARDWDNLDRARCQRNWNLYAGLDLGQYTVSDQQQALLEGRDLATFNITTQKIDSLGGYVLKNRFDADYIPVEGDEGKLTQILKQMYLSDKNMMDWDGSYSSLVKGGLIYQAWEEMFIDRKYHPLGNIAFRTHLPGYVVKDPRWKSGSGRDQQMCWVVSFLTGSQVAELWPEKVNTLNFVQRDLERIKSQGEQFDSINDTTVTPMFEADDFGTGFNYYRIIRKFEMVTEDVEVEYDKSTGLTLPAGGDYAKKLAFLNKNNPSWEPDSIGKRMEKRRVCMVTTVCRQLDTNDPLEKKPCEIQIGRLPLFPWSADNINGKARGIVDILADIQYKINYREELITNIIETEACGAKLVDPMLFGDDEDKMFDFEKFHNQPNKIIWTAPGAMQRNLDPRPVAKAQFPQDARDQLTRMWDYADRISKAPAVFDARSEKSGESGYLFAQKARVAEQQSYTLFESLKRYEQEKAEAYMEQAKIQYTIAGVERWFKYTDGISTMSIGINVKNDETGETLNDFSQLPRHKVVISESPVSTTNRMVTRALATELLRVIPPDAMGTRQVFTSALVESLDTFNPKDKEKLMKFREIEEGIVLETLKINFLNLKMQSLGISQKYDDMQKQAAAAKATASTVPPAAPGSPAPVPSSPAPMGGEVAAAAPSIETQGVGGNIGSMEGGPVPPEKSQGYQGGGPVAGPMEAPATEPSAPVPTAPAAAAPAPAPEQAPPSPAEMVDQVAQATGGSVSISFKSKPPPKE